MLKPLAARGQLAFGPPGWSAPGREGAQRPSRGTVTFVAPREWIGRWTDVAPDDAVQDVLCGFLGAYGPAGLDDLYRWSALDKPVLRRALAAMADELELSWPTR